MNVFTDQTETSFYKTDDYLKNLHLIEITSIKDFVFKYSLDEMILLGAKSWMVTRFDELKPGKPAVEHFSDEPELYGEWLNIDFVENMKLLDILFEIGKHVSIDSAFLGELKKSGVFSEMNQTWENNNEDEVWSMKAWSDSRLLCLIIDGNDKVTIQIQEG